MYRHCIYCSADLGANESLEGFPVGRAVAFDTEKGRLWAVCRACARWNLAPLEERWEPVEAAEKAFADTRLRVQRESIGIAKLRDGTRLIRVGKAVPGELAAWRYGDQLARRRRRALWVGGATVAAYAVATGFNVAGLLPSLLAFSGPNLIWGLSLVERQVRRNWAVHRLSPAGRDAGPVVLRRKHLDGARLGPGDGELRVVLPQAPSRDYDDPLVVDGPEASRLLQRIMVVRNNRGATPRELNPALKRLAEAGSAREMIDVAVQERKELVADPPAFPQSFKLPRRRPRRVCSPNPLTAPAALALEMALHEESERRALEGELALLQSAWREAEEIAGIADRLAGESGLLR
jgi:hypothetical protein